MFIWGLKTMLAVRLKKLSNREIKTIWNKK